MPPETDKNALLGQLRIDRTQREADTGPGRRPWIIGAVVLLVALLVAGAWLGVSGRAALPVHSAESLLAQYEAQLAQSQRDLKRAEDLLERKLVSAQAVEQARTQVDAQTAQVQAQRRQIELTAASVRSARVQLEYCTVHAPFSGVVIAKAAQVGEIVSPFSAGGGYT